MRCLALVQAYVARGGRAILASRSSSDPLRARAEATGATWHRIDATPGSIEDANEVVALAREAGADRCVIDGYVFGGEFQRALRAAGLRVVVVDDHGRMGAHEVDIVVDQNLGTSAALYPRRDPRTQLLLGPRFALLRREFVDHAQPRRERPHVATRLLVTMGGADMPDATSRVLRALAKVPYPIEVDVLVGAQNPREEALRDLVSSLPFAVTLHIDTPDVPSLLRGAHLVIAAAGSTSWEICHVGAPLLAGAIADNQVPVAEALAAHGVARNLGRFDALTEDRTAAEVAALIPDPVSRGTMGDAGRALVDGRGADRVVATMVALDLRLVRAREEHARVLWEWANDLEVRSNSFHPDPIPWEAHERWLSERLTDPACRIWIAYDGDEPIGQVRFEADTDGAWRIDVSIARRFRSLGIGRHLLEKGAEALFGSTDAVSVTGTVKLANEASRRAFARAGFGEVSRGRIAGSDVVVYRKARDTRWRNDHA